MNDAQRDLILARYAEQLDELQIETAALGTAVRAMLDLWPDKEAFATQFRHVMRNSKTKPLSPASLAEHVSRHEALLARLTK